MPSLASLLGLLFLAARLVSPKSPSLVFNDDLSVGEDVPGLASIFLPSLFYPIAIGAMMK